MILIILWLFISMCLDGFFKYPLLVCLSNFILFYFQTLEFWKEISTLLYSITYPASPVKGISHSICPILHFLTILPVPPKKEKLAPPTVLCISVMATPTLKLFRPKIYDWSWFLNVYHSIQAVCQHICGLYQNLSRIHHFSPTFLLPP